MITDKEKLEYCIADAGLAFIQGKYDESLKLAKQALELYSKNPDAQKWLRLKYL